MPSPLYPHLTFQPHVDWQHINPVLLLNLERLAASRDIKIDVFSGYRDNKYSAANGGFSGDPHSQGRAVDANVNGRPIGDIVPLNVLARYGLIGGNQPNFYHGKPDPEHIQLPQDAADQDGTAKMVTTADVGQPTTANTGDISTTTPAQQPAQPAATPRPAPKKGKAPTPQVQPQTPLPTAPAIDEANLPVGPPQPEGTLPMVLAPGSGSIADAATGGGGYASRLWAQIASQPNASPDTLAYVQNVALGG